LKIAEENGSDRLKKLIFEEQEEFKSESGTLQKLDTVSPLTVRMESIDFSKKINGVKKAGITQEQVITKEIST